MHGFEVSATAGDSVILFHKWKEAEKMYRAQLDHVADLNGRRHVIECRVAELAPSISPDDIGQQHILLEYRSSLLDAFWLF